MSEEVLDRSGPNARRLFRHLRGSRPAHRTISARVRQEPHGLQDDPVLVGADEAHRAGADGLGTFGGIAQDEDRLPEGRRSSCTPPLSVSTISQPMHGRTKSP